MEASNIQIIDMEASNIQIKLVLPVNNIGEIKFC
jgi:hypothetical protein